MEEFHLKSIYNAVTEIYTLTEIVSLITIILIIFMIVFFMLYHYRHRALIRELKEIKKSLHSHDKDS